MTDAHPLPMSALDAHAPPVARSTRRRWPLWPPFRQALQAPPAPMSSSDASAVDDVALATTAVDGALAPEAAALAQRATDANTLDETDAVVSAEADHVSRSPTLSVRAPHVQRAVTRQRDGSVRRGARAGEATQRPQRHRARTAAHVPTRRRRLAAAAFMTDVSARRLRAGVLRDATSKGDCSSWGHRLLCPSTQCIPVPVR
eukprot:ctg_1899.g569